MCVYLGHLVELADPDVPRTRLQTRRRDLFTVPAARSVAQEIAVGPSSHNA